MLKMKVGDKVIVNCGKDKGKIGFLSKIFTFSKEKNREIKVIVENINFFKKHVKGNPNKNIKSGIIDKEKCMSYSNISIYNGSISKRDKIIFDNVNGKKIRLYKSNKEVVK